MLKPDNFDQSGLVYWNEFKVFSTSPERTLDLEELAGPLLIPRLYLEPVGHGLSLRLATVKEILDADEGEDPGREIALIPWVEFRGYKNQKKKTECDSQLAKHGWERGDDEDCWLEAPFELRHKFFTVEWKYV